MKGRYISALLVVIMLLSLASCSSDAPTADDEVRDFTKEVCDNVIAGDYNFFEENSLLDEKKDRDLEDVLDVYYDNDMWDKDQKKISDYIKDSLSYEIDYNSAYASHARKTGEIDVYFKYVDYKTLFNTCDCTSIKDYYKELKDYDKTTEQKVHITFVMEKKHWVLADYEKIFVDLFTWKDFHYDFTLDYSKYIEGTEWNGAVGANLDEYHNTIYLELDIFASSKVDLSTDCYYKVFRDGEEIYEADVMSSDYLSKYYYVLYNGYLLNNGEPIDEGTYTITVYDFNDNEVLSESCTVVKDGDSGSGGVSIGSGRSVEFGDSDFVDYISQAGWYERHPSKMEYDIWYSIGSAQSFEYYFELYDADGNVFYTSDTLEISSNSSYIELIVSADDAGVDDIKESLDTIVVYDGDGKVILTDYD